LQSRFKLSRGVFDPERGHRSKKQKINSADVTSQIGDLFLRWSLERFLSWKTFMSSASRSSV